MQLRAAMVAGCAAILVSATACTVPVRPDPPPSPTSAPVAPTTRAALCAGTVRLVSSDGRTTVVDRSGATELSVRLGDAVRVEADGRCGSSVRLQPGRGLERAGAALQEATATRVGSTHVELSHPSCAGVANATPDCRGGISSDGGATVVVRAR